MNTTTTMTKPKRSPYVNDMTILSDGSYTYDTDLNGVITRAMRVVRTYWPIAYNKLLSLRWEHTLTATPYGATDGRRLILNPRGIDKLIETTNPVGYAAFLLVHEALHALLNHGTRLRKFTDHESANVAADYIINAMIKKHNLAMMNAHGLKRPPFPMIDGCLIDEDKSADKDVERLYGEIMADKPAPDAPPTNPEPPQGEDGEDGEDGGNPAPPTDDPPESGAGAGDTESESESDSNDPAEQGGAADDGETGSGSGGKQTDGEILGDEFAGGAKAPDAIPPEIDTEHGETEQEVADQIEQENERIFLNDELNESCGLGGNSGSRELRGAQDEAKLSQPWEDIIRDWMSYSTASGWVSPFNQQVYQVTGMVAAGRGGRKINSLVFIIDTSGSMSGGALKDIMGKVQTVVDELKPRTTSIISCDNDVREVHDVELGGYVPETLRGGGGTQFAPALRYVEEHYPDADGIIYLTDGFSFDLPHLDEPTQPMLWLTYGKKADSYPFGDAIEVSLHE